jgi:hypothetical protein
VVCEKELACAAGEASIHSIYIEDRSLPDLKTDLRVLAPKLIFHEAGQGELEDTNRPNPHQ